MISSAVYRFLAIVLAFLKRSNLNSQTGPISSGQVNDGFGNGEVLDVGYTNYPSDPAAVLGVILSGRWIGEYDNFSNAARGSDVQIMVPSSKFANGVIEFYIRKRSGTYDSNYGQNFGFILER